MPGGRSSRSSAAVLAYGLATALGGSGFIAAFVAGALFGHIARERAASAMRFTEETGAALDGVTFLVFGAVLLGPACEHLSWQIAVYAVLSLTIVRMLPVAIGLWGTKARAPTVAFMGWFGPRGLASIVFAVIVEDAHLAHGADDRRRHLPHRRRLGPRARTLGGAARQRLRQLVPNRRERAPAGDGEQARARAPDAWPRRAAEQLTAERRRCRARVVPAPSVKPR